ncbi:unnamed protein product [Brassica oleracea]
MIMVKAVKWVDEVIPDAPYAITEEFMKRLFDEYRIDYIIHGMILTFFLMELMLMPWLRRLGGISRSSVLKEFPALITLIRAVNGRMFLCVRERSNSQNHSFLQRLFSHGHNSPRFEDGASSAGGPGAHIIYIDGAFDLFHAGHVEILRRARELGDIIKRALVLQKNSPDDMLLLLQEHNIWSNSILLRGFHGVFWPSHIQRLLPVAVQCCSHFSLRSSPLEFLSKTCLQKFAYSSLHCTSKAPRTCSSTVIFALNLGIFHVQSFCSNGQTADMNALGTAMFTCIVWAVNVQIALTMSYFTWIQHALIWGSIFTWYIFLALFGMLPPKISGNIFHMLLESLAPAPIFWLTTLLVIAATTLPYLAHISFQRSLNPLDHHIIQEIKHFKIDVQDERMWTRERSKARQKTKIGFIARVDAKIRQLRGRIQKNHLILSVVRGMSGTSASASSETTTTTTHHS